YSRAYEDTMKRIKSEPSAVLVLKTISWIALIKRPLLTEELRYALAVESRNETFDPDGLTEIEVILSACAGLITIERQTHLVRFIHYT
ncbi:hypothetical protein BU23DRAFT_433176, partial [Bimuria novae-zelandiae CBS 107.79]